MSKSCQELSVRNICQLRNDTVANERESIVLINDFGYIVCSGILYCISLHNDSDIGIAVFDGLLSIALFSQENKIILALTEYGSVIALYCDGTVLEKISDVAFDETTPSLNCTTARGHIIYDIERNVMVILRNEAMTVHSVLGFTNDIIETSTLFEGHVEQPNFICKLWGSAEDCLVAYSTYSEDFSVVFLTRTLTEGTEAPWRLQEANSITTKHTAWITALSEVTTGFSEIFASGDCVGTLILWRATFTGAAVQPAVRSGKKPKKAKAPLKLLIKDATVCGGHAITSILIDTVLNDLWVADISGAIHCVHLSVVSKTLHPLRRLTLFGTLGGASFLQWNPATEGNADNIEYSYNNGNGNEEKQAKQADTGMLRAFSPACGMLVECSISENVESVFKIWMEPVLSPAPVPLTYENGGGKAEAAEVSAIGAHVIDVCAMLPGMNLMATTSCRSRLIQLWDLHSGQLEHSIQMNESFCKALSGCDIPPTAQSDDGPTILTSAWLAAGYHNGQFVLLKLHKTSVRVAAAAAAAAGSEAKLSKKQRKDSRLSVEQSRASGHSGARQRLLSAHEVDILGAIAMAPHQGVDYVAAPGAHLDDDERSEGSEVEVEAPLHRGRLSSEDNYQLTDEDEDNGEEGEEGQPSRKHNRQRGRRASVQGNRSFTHSIELSTSFCPLPITDIFFSSTGDFIAVCHIRRVIVVYNNHEDAKKVSLRVTFNEMFSDIRTLVPSELISEAPSGKYDATRRHSTDRASAHSEPSDRDRRTSTQTTLDPPISTTEDGPVESFLLVLQTVSQLRLLDGITGTILAEVDLGAVGQPVISCGMWSMTSRPYNPAMADHAITGLCVARNMQIFVWNEQATSRQLYLHDQQPHEELFDPFSPSLLSTHHNNNTTNNNNNTNYNNPHPQTEHFMPHSRVFSALDNLIQGVTIRELSTFSPLACVWSTRRLALLRVQLLHQRGAEVLRCEEYALSHENVRIVYASALKAAPRTRNHRAVLVLSNGHMILLHL